MFSVCILLILIEMFAQLTSSQTSFPLFSSSTSQEVHVLLGEDLLLHCQGEHLGHHTVSWTRHKDLQILTIGSHKFTTDDRISVKHDPRDGDFKLQIKLFSEEDTGSYECQINTSPVKINVVKIKTRKSKDLHHIASLGGVLTLRSNPRKPQKLELPENSGSSTSIIGSPDIYFYSGSLVNISCLVTSLQQPEHIFWYHDGEVVSYYSARGGISIVRKMGMDETTTMSSLIIRKAGEEDQGTYTCRPETGDFKTATTRLFIGQGAVSGSRVSGVGRMAGGGDFYKIVVVLSAILFFYDEI